VLEQVEDVADLHLGERRLELGANGSQFETGWRKLAGSTRPVDRRHLLDADGVRVQRLIAFVHLTSSCGCASEVLLEPSGVGLAASAPEHGDQLTVVVGEAVDEADGGVDCGLAIPTRHRGWIAISRPP
jgi:hypothetical protein